MSIFRCPKNHTLLTEEQEQSLCRMVDTQPVIDFSGEVEQDNKDLNEIFYSGQEQNELYRNFLNWLFATFRTEDAAFRQKLLAKLHAKDGAKILITGCGNGDDVLAAVQYIDVEGLEIHAQDISREMVFYTAKACADKKLPRIVLSISDAVNLPYNDGVFDAAFHFGGINFMPSVKQAIAEMTRVVKHQGIVAFGDEGIAPWLRHTEYYKMMVENNSLWSAPVPWDMLPENANEVNITWVLENCFYFIDFVKDDSFPSVDIDVTHIGKRGGSIRTRYFGKLEGVTDEAQRIAIEKAKEEGVSIHTWLDQLIKDKK